MEQVYPGNAAPAPAGGGRRRFLKAAAASAAATAIPRTARAAARAAMETILVVGAGLAGLCAAHRLREAGKRVIVIEARPVPGGRVRTLRGYFDDGLYAGLGAARVPGRPGYVLNRPHDLKLS